MNRTPYLSLLILFLLTPIISADIVCLEMGTWVENTSDRLSGNATTSLGNAANAGNGGQVINGSSTFLIDSMPTGVSFTLTVSSIGDGGTPNAQGRGMGVQGGRAGSGIDNNSNNSGGTNGAGDYSEALQFTISNVSGGTVVFDAFRLAFTEDVTDEKVVVNSAAFEDATEGLRSVAGEGTGSILTIAAPSQNVFDTDSRYVVDELCFDIVAATVPEPSSFGLLIVGLGLCARRRR